LVKKTLGLEGYDSAYDLEEVLVLFRVGLPVGLGLPQVVVPHPLVVGRQQLRRHQAVVLEVHVVQFGLVLGKGFEFLGEKWLRCGRLGRFLM
jgi:hypothetical protein